MEDFSSGLELSMQASNNDKTLATTARLLSFLCARCDATYALLWTFSGGRLCVLAAGAKNNQSRAFVEASCSTMMSPGEGAVGRVFQTQVRENLFQSSFVGRFIRADLAELHGIGSIMFQPWKDSAVIELGSRASWNAPSHLSDYLSAVTGMSASLERPLESKAWEGVLWKLSSFWRVWRQRHLTLTNKGPAYELESWDMWTGKLTGTWELEKNMPKIKITSNRRFQAVMKVQGIVLASNTDAGADAMKELATIFNGGFMRYGLGGHQGSHVASRDKASEDGSTTAASCGSDSETSDEVQISFGKPDCESCCHNRAAGRLIIRPVGCVCKELGRWLCPRCFSKEWAQFCNDDGRLEARPRWLVLTSTGSLSDSTPPALSRYSSVSQH